MRVCMQWLRWARMRARRRSRLRGRPRDPVRPRAPPRLLCAVYAVSTSTTVRADLQHRKPWSGLFVDGAARREVVRYLGAALGLRCWWGCVGAVRTQHAQREADVCVSVRSIVAVCLQPQGLARGSGEDVCPCGQSGLGSRALCMHAASQMCIVHMYGRACRCGTHACRRGGGAIVRASGRVVV